MTLNQKSLVLPMELLTAKKSVKWRDRGADVLPLPVAEMDYEIAPEIKELLIGMISQSDTGYLGTCPELFQSMAEFFAKRWNWEVTPEWIYTCTDVGVGMVEVSRRLLKKGDQILINSPVYHNFYNWITELQCSVLDVPLLRDGMEYRLDLAAISEAYKNGVKVHFLCNPQNPVGTVHSEAELIEIAKLAKAHGVTVLSDEIHAPLTFAENKFHPFLNVCPEAKEVGITATSASKSWNLAGLKCAQIIVASEKMKAVTDSMPYSVHFRASLVGAFAQSIAWKSFNWLDEALTELDGMRNYLAELLATKLPKVKYRIPNASYLAWLDFADYGIEGEISEFLLTEAKVSINPGKIFDPSASSIGRLNFATSREIVEEAINRIAKVF
jgi:cysteine-S-conjugate beta-lyase